MDDKQFDDWKAAAYGGRLPKLPAYEPIPGQPGTFQRFLCDPPPEGAGFQVLREVWDEDFTHRTILEVRLIDGSEGCSEGCRHPKPCPDHDPDYSEPACAGYVGSRSLECLTCGRPYGEHSDGPGSET